MCILCDNWAATPYSKRPTTDIACSTGHELMLLGFYLGAQAADQDPVPILCPAHEKIMQEIADHKEGVARAEAALAANPIPKENLTLQAAYKDRIARLNVGPSPAQPPVPPSFTVQSVGLKVPLMGADVIPPAGSPMPIPPTQGVDPNMLFECPNCKKMVTNGLVHDCQYVP